MLLLGALCKIGEAASSPGGTGHFSVFVCQDVVPGNLPASSSGYDGSLKPCNQSLMSFIVLSL